MDMKWHFMAFYMQMQHCMVLCPFNPSDLVLIDLSINRQKQTMVVG